MESEASSRLAQAKPNQKQTTDAPDSQRVVVFADLLGFAALTESNPLDVRMLHAHNRPLSLNIEDILSAPKNQLTETFSRFHRSLKWSIMTASMSHALTAITFSDSVFVATNYLFEAATFATSLIQSMLSQQIPLRIGLGFGSFAALSFRSEVSTEGGDHAAQFLGTAVVRSYQAERCGIKGLRVLLHPSVESLIADDTHNPTSSNGRRRIKAVQCSPAESKNSAGVGFELDYWTLPITKERSAWHALQNMWRNAPDSACEHYQATAEAISRMRVAQGKAGLTNLRRRTLPKK